jgi:sulfur-carrier protein adenylyltransferase/sulfurtransferase
MWFFGDPARLQRERAAVADLMSDADWLQDVDWGLTTEARIKLDFAIVVGEQRFSLRMTYPKLFPFTPPEVAPVGHDRRLSAHQYGDATGNLCLQHRPDNWLPTITGADMIRSAFNLLSAESPAEGPARQVPSDHRLTAGQEFRWKSARLLIPRDIGQLLSSLDEGAPAQAEVRWTYHSHSSVAAIKKVVLADGTEWEPSNFPKTGTVYRGIAARVSAAEYRAIVEDSEGTLAAILRDKVAGEMSLVEYADKEFIIVTDGEGIILVWQLLPQKPDMTVFEPLRIDDEGPSRLPAGYDALAGKKVAIIGCGSAGSKIAASLARDGVGAFLLIDDDLYLRDNLVRNDLDWRNVGVHKVDGVTRRIRAVNPGAKVEVRRIRLTGQESAASAASALDQVAACDLIVDATAEPNVFNLLASVSMTAKKPMVWLEVFAGGIGGMVARHLAGIDETPQVMRNAYNNWCRSRAVPWIGAAAGAYAVNVGNGPVLVADDADVSVIAAHAARMASDALTAGGGFPHSMYVVSLRAGWIFDEPFEAYPIDAEKPAETPETEIDPEEREQGVKFLIEDILSKVGDETAAS